MRDLTDVILSYGFKLKERGNRYECLCPAHDDHNPSMSVYPDGYAHCFVCGFHENNYGFVAFMESLDKEHDKKKIMAILGDPLYKRNGAKYATIEAEKLPPRAMRETYAPPPDAPDPVWERANYKNEDDEWVSLGTPVKIWAFKTSEGALSYYECRYEVTTKDGEIKKEPRCWSWGHRGAMPPRWECAAPNKPRPLFGMDKLATAGQILIAEGPKTAEAAQSLLGDGVACLAWPCGSNGAKYADWGSLTTYTDTPVILCPDADDAGVKAMHYVASQLISLGFKDIKIINTDGLEKGFDIADGVYNLGWDVDKLILWLRERKQDYIAPSMPEQTEPGIQESRTTEPPNDPSPPIDAYEEVGIRWQEPVDIFAEFQAQHITKEMLPISIAEWGFDAAHVIGCDPSITCMSAIVVCAAALHDDIKVQPEARNTKWKESARLWLALIGDSSMKKTPGLIHAVAPLRKIDVECNDNEKKLRYAFKLKQQLFDDAEKDYIKRMKTGDESNQPIPPELPEIPRAISQDATIESIRDILKHSSRGLMALHDELSGWFASMDAYKKTGGGDRSAWLELYNGGARRFDRVGTGSVFVKNWASSLIGAIQPDKMTAVMSNMPEDGLLQRFMVVYGRPGNQGPDIPFNDAAHDHYHAIVKHIWETKPSYQSIVLTDEAQAIRKGIIDEAYRLINLKFCSSAFMSHMGKWEGLSARLMLTYHAIECASKGVHPEAAPITEDTAMRVSLLMRSFLLQNAVAFYSNVGNETTHGKRIRAIAGMILARGESAIARRDIAHGYEQWRHMKEWERDTCMNSLVESGWLQPMEKRSIDRSPTRYLVNPALFDTFAAKQQAEIRRREEWHDFYKSMRRGNDD